MKKFKITDLIINMNGPYPFNTCSTCHASRGTTGGFRCGPWSLGPCGFVSQHMPWPCVVTHPEGPAGYAGDPFAFAPPEQSLIALAMLKKQLQEQLEQVEKEETELEESLSPKTVADVDALTAKLNEALSELKVLRAELAKAAETKSAEKR